MDINTIANLGVAGFAILIMWWKDQAAADERKRYEDSFRQLETEVRNNISTQLLRSTETLAEATKVLRQVIEYLKADK